MAFAALPILAGSAAVSAVGSIMQGQAQSDAANYNAAIARQNAEIARQQGEAAAQAQNRDAQRKMGSMVAAYGASGVQSDTGSPMEALMDSARMATLDNLTIKYDADLRARGYQSQAVLSSANAKSASTAGVIGAVGAAGRGVAGYLGMNPSLGSTVDTTDINGWR